MVMNPKMLLKRVKEPSANLEIQRQQQSLRSALIPRQKLLLKNKLYSNIDPRDCKSDQTDAVNQQISLCFQQASANNMRGPEKLLKQDNAQIVGMPSNFVQG